MGVTRKARRGPNPLLRGTMIVYLNGAFIDHADARVSVDDRGFLFADGIYEVIRVYEGRLFMAEPHMDRLRAGLNALRMDPGAAGGLLEVAERLLDENDLRAGDATVYMQITRGAAPRKHAFPSPGIAPTVYVAAKAFAQHPTDYFEHGVGAITVADTRWSRCDIKSISLLPNVVANQQAKEKGAFEALFVRDGALIEGSHSNLFGVMDGELRTYPECNYILGGITRRLIIELAAENGIVVREAPMYAHEIDDVDELFLSGTTTEVMPITTLDGSPLGEGRPGPVSRRLLQAFRERTSVLRMRRLAEHAGRRP
jgi:D-alanine transaminase